MTDDSYTIESGMLDVGDGHQIYYQRWGNPDRFPIYALHGGPGSRSKDRHKRMFDPTVHQVVFHDQRGCGQSTFNNLLNNNTADARSHDISALAAHFGHDAFNIFGYSWGSTLALYYASQHPENVNKMLIGGLYLASRAENDYLYRGGQTPMRPEVWERYIAQVPQDNQDDPIAYYASVFESGNEQKIRALLPLWQAIEGSSAALDDDYDATAQFTVEQPDSLDDLNDARINAQYFLNDCYIPSDFFESQLSKLQDMPIIMVQGSFDLTCPPYIADKTKRLIGGEKVRLHYVPSAHARQSVMHETLRAYAWSFLS